MSTTEELLAAIRGDNAPCIERLLAHDPSLLDRPPVGPRPLTAAVYAGAARAREVLLAHGLQPTLFEAAMLGDLARLDARIDAEPAAIASYSPDGWTALHLAAHFGQEAVARRLLERGAAVMARSTNGLTNTPLHAALAGRHAALVELLVAHGADINDRQHGGFTPLHQAAQNGDESMVAFLLGHGAGVGASADDGRTALAFARDQGHAGVMEILRQHGATT